MPRSVVDISQLNALDAAIRAFDSNTGASMAAYSQSAMNHLAQFEAKLNELDIIRQNALNALNSCEWTRATNPDISCASQAAAFHRANERYSRCAELVNQARQAISEYDSYASRFCQAKSDLCSRARTGLDRVMATIEEYNSNATPNTDNVMSNGMPVATTTSGPVENVSNDKLPGGGSFMFVRGGEQIEHIQPKGSGTDPVRIDPDAMAKSLDGLPEITSPDKSTLRIAASGIFAAMAAGGLVIGGRELLLQQKTDEIFESQYGISRTELLLKSGPKQKEYVKAYNEIYNGLKHELKEKQKEDIDGKLIEINNKIQANSMNKDLLSLRAIERLKVDQINLQNKKMTLENGLIRPQVPYGASYVAGLSEKEMLSMMDNMTPDRFATSLIALRQSDKYELTQDINDTYTFSNGQTRMDIAHDGKRITVTTAYSGGDCESNISIGGGMEVEQGAAAEWSQNHLEAGINKSPISSAVGEASKGAKCSYAWQYRQDNYYISEDGSVLKTGYGVAIGPEGYVKGGIGVNSPLSFSSEDRSLHLKTPSVNVSGSAGIDVGKGGGHIGVSTIPVRVGDTIHQAGLEVSAEAKLGGSIGGGVEVSPKKGFKAGAKASALIGVGGQLNWNALSLDELPSSVAERMKESSKTPMDVITESVLREWKTLSNLVVNETYFIGDSVERAGRIDIQSYRIKQ